jgi:uncharacterized protein
MSDFLVALGLLFVLEGLVCAAFPGSAKRAATTVIETPEQTMRIIGIVSAIAGIAVIWLVRG